MTMSSDRETVTRKQKTSPYRQIINVDHKTSMIWFLEQFLKEINAIHASCGNNSCIEIFFLVFGWSVMQKNGVLFCSCVAVAQVKTVKNAFTLYIFDKLIENPKVA